MRFKILARHKWVANATITESVGSEGDGHIRRFTATICGFRNWKIYEGRADDPRVGPFVRDKVIEIRDRIESGNQEIFVEENEFCRRLDNEKSKG